MKIYFAAAIRGDRALADTVRELIRFLQTQGRTVLTEHLLKDDPVDVIPPEEVERRDISWVDDADCLIAEISGSSTGVGREIEYARNKELFGKNPTRVLCIYRKDREYHASAMVRGMTQDHYPNVTVRSYLDLEDAKRIVQDFSGRG